MTTTYWGVGGYIMQSTIMRKDDDIMDRSREPWGTLRIFSARITDTRRSAI